MKVKHTTCVYCGLEIEGLAPYRKGTWYDRGGDTMCSAEGEEASPTGLHAPYIERKQTIRLRAEARQRSKEDK